MVTMSTMTAGCLALLLLNASPAAAQATFGELPKKVRLGQKVIVYDDQGHTTTGTVERVSATELVLGGGPAPRTFKPEGVQRVRKPGPVWNGALVGAVFGLIPAVIVAGNLEGDSGSFIAGLTGLGAGIGLGIDAAIPPRTLYRRAGTGSRVALMPIVSRDRRGFAAAFRF